jgi:hypothetical protein
VLELLFELIGRHRHLGSIEAVGHDIYVGTNDEFSLAASYAEPPDFVAFAISVEVASDDQQVSIAEYLERVGLIMNALHGAGMAVVASCSWEHLLPGGGKLGL